MNGETIAMIKALQVKSIEELKTSGGSADAGKVLTVGSDGKLIPAELEVGEGQVAVDGSLSVSGAAADAKKVGDALSAVNGSLENLNDTVNEHLGMSYFPVEKGNFTASGDGDSVASIKYYCRTVSGFWIDCVDDTKITIFNKDPNKYKFSIARYDANGNYITATLWINTFKYEYTVLSGYKCRVRFTTLSANVEISVDEISNNFTYETEYLDMPTTVDSLDNSWKLSNSVDRVLTNYSLPNDFSATNFPITIYTDRRKYFYNFNESSFKTTGGITYYCKPYNTNESDGDGTKENPIMLYTYLTTLQADGDTLILQDGVYCDLAKVKNSSDKIHKNINIIAENSKRVIFVGNEYGYLAAQVWSKNENSRTYINNNSEYVKGATKIVQKFMGRFFALQRVDTYALCNSTEGTWYKKDDNSSPYIHLFGNEIPTYANVFVNNITLPILYCNSDNQNINLYIEGLIFIGGGNGGVLFRNSQIYLNPKLCAVDCDFLHSYDGDLSNDAISILGANAYFVRCRAMYASKDGFNYHKYNDVPANFIEIDCIGSNNGVDGVAESNPSSIAYSQNGSTSHDNAKGIRINGLYYNNYGTNLADVSGSKTVNIQCSVYEGAETLGGDKYDCDFGTITDDGNSVMYIESCRSFGTKNSIYVATGTEMHINNSDLNGEIINNGTLYINGSKVLS